MQLLLFGFPCTYDARDRVERHRQEIGLLNLWIWIEGQWLLIYGCSNQIFASYFKINSHLTISRFGTMHNTLQLYFIQIEYEINVQKWPPATMPNNIDLECGTLFAWIGSSQSPAHRQCEPKLITVVNESSTFHAAAQVCLGRFSTGILTIQNQQCFCFQYDSISVNK